MLKGIAAGLPSQALSLWRKPAWRSCGSVEPISGVPTAPGGWEAQSATKHTHLDTAEVAVSSAKQSSYIAKPRLTGSRESRALSNQRLL